jgi:hypothetical protein
MIFSAALFYVVNQKKGDGIFWIVLYLLSVAVFVSISSIPPHIASVFLGSLIIAVFEITSFYWEKSLVVFRLARLTKFIHKE